MGNVENDEKIRDFRVSKEQKDTMLKFLETATPNCEERPTLKQTIIDIYPQLKIALGRGFTKKELYEGMLDDKIREVMTYPTFLAYIRNAETDYAKKKKEDIVSQRKSKNLSASEKQSNDSGKNSVDTKNHDKNSMQKSEKNSGEIDVKPDKPI